jgi:hypothetical protein
MLPLFDPLLLLQLSIYEVTLGMTIFCTCTIIIAAFIMFSLSAITARSLWLYIVALHCRSLLGGVNKRAYAPSPNR